MSSGDQRFSILQGALMVVSVITALVVLGMFLYAIASSLHQVGRQSLDVWSRAAWMVEHWPDAEAFPPKAELCAAPFCRRADTEPTYVGGNPGHRSETRMAFCREHLPALPTFGGRFDDLLRFTYWALAMVLSLMEAGAVLFIISSPVMLLRSRMRQSGADSNGLLGKLLTGVEAILALVMVLTLAAWLTAWLMFAWW